MHNYQDRLFFVRPENADAFPGHFSLIQKLLYSPKAMKRIRQLIKGKPAVLVPGYPSNDDIKLAHELSVPIFSGDPQLSLVNSTKSAAKRIFQSASIPTPVGSFEIYDEVEFINTLTILIANNRTVATWLFKIDDEFMGRGIAYLNMDTLPGVVAIISSGSFDSDEVQVKQIRQILQSSIASKIRFVLPSLYHSYAEYMSIFTKRGGIIEAVPSNMRRRQISSPTLSLFVSPVGEISLLATFDKISGQQYLNIGYQFPSKSLSEQKELQLISQQVGNCLYQKGVFGYVSVDLILCKSGYQEGFPGEQGDAAKFFEYYGIGIDCYLNNLQSSFFYFNYLVGGKFNQQTGVYLAPIPEQVANNKSQINQPRYYFYCPFIYHEGLTSITMKNFF